MLSLPALRPHLGEPLSLPESEPASRSAITGGKLACLFQLPEYSGMLLRRRGSSVHYQSQLTTFDCPGGFIYYSQIVF